MFGEQAWYDVVVVIMWKYQLNFTELFQHPSFVLRVKAVKRNIKNVLADYTKRIKRQRLSTQEKIPEFPNLRKRNINMFKVSTPATMSERTQRSVSDLFFIVMFSDRIVIFGA